MVKNKNNQASYYPDDIRNFMSQMDRERVATGCTHSLPAT